MSWTDVDNGVTLKQHDGWQDVDTITPQTSGWQDVNQISASDIKIKSKQSTTSKEEGAGFFESLGRGVASMPYVAGQAAVLPVYGAATLVDKARKAFGATDEIVSDTIAKYALDPARRTTEKLKPNKFSGTSANVAYAVPTALADIGGQLALGGPATAAYKPAATQVNKAIKFGLDEFAKFVTPSVATAIPMASKQSAEAYTTYKEKGVSEPVATAAATIKGLYSILDLAAPVSTQGPALSRLVQGAIIGPTSNRADYESQKVMVGNIAQEPTTVDQIVASVLGATFATIGGSNNKQITPEQIRLINEAFDLINKEIQVEDAKTKQAYPTINPEFVDKSYTDIDAAQTQFADSLVPEETTSGRTPSTPIERPTFPEAKGADLPLPELLDDFQTERPSGWQQDWQRSPIPENRIPYQEPQGAVPNEPFVDVREGGPNPYVPEGLVEQANVDQLPGVGEMTFVPDDGTIAGPRDMGMAEGPRNPFVNQSRVDQANTQGLQGTDKMTFRRNKSDPLQSPASKHIDDVDVPSTTKRMSTAFVNAWYKAVSSMMGPELRGVKNIKDAIDIAIKYELDPDLRDIAHKILSVAKEQDAFFVLHPDEVEGFAPDHPARLLLDDGTEGALGIHNLTTKGRKRIYLRSDKFTSELGKKSGIYPEAVFHEGAHSVTDHTWFFAEDPVLSKDPKYAAHVRYAKGMDELLAAIKREYVIEKDYEPFFENGKELNAYGWTNPVARKLLSDLQLKTYGRTALQRFFDLVKEFLHIKKRESKNALDIMDKFLDDLDNIKTYDRLDLEEAIARKKDTQKVTELASKVQDIKPTQDIGPFKKLIPMTMNQKVEFLKHPILKFAYDHIRTIVNEEDTRFNLYKTYLNEVEDLIKRDRSGALNMFKVLSDIQNPELKAARQQAQDTNTREAFLKQQGMPDHLIAPAIKVLNIMQIMGKYDQNMALYGMGHSWNLEPMYFPREHTGPFVVTLTDGNGKITYMRGFDSSPAAHKYKEAFEAATKDKGYTVSLDRHEAGSLGDVMAMMNLTNDNLPDFLKDISNKLIKEIEVAKRKFEMERAAHNIAGYTGEAIYHSNNPFSYKRSSDNKLLTLLQRRLEQSFELATKARIIKEIKEPFLNDPAVMDNQPNARALLDKFVWRELGIDVSKFKAMGTSIDKGLNAVGKEVDKLAGLLRGYKGGDVSFFAPKEIARLVQAYTWTLSAFKLALAPPVLLANTTTLLATPFDGFRTAAIEGKSGMFAPLALIKTLTARSDAAAMQFMKEANLEGMIEPRISDPITIVQSHARGSVDKAINAPRDIIEKATNYTGVLFYYNFYKLSEPNLSGKELKTKVYKASRSWTGDYSQQSQLMAISEAGDLGRLFSNFAKWKFNQIGRLANDIQMIGEGKVLPFAYTMMIATALAGAVGAPIAVEYEAIRRLGMKMGWWDLPPLAGALYKGKDTIEKEFGKPFGVAADTMIKGPMAAGTDLFFKELGVESGPDLSSNLRYSSVLDVSTLPVQFAKDVWKFADVRTRTILQHMGIGNGVTAQDLKDATKGMPTVVGNIVEEEIKKRIQPPINTPQGKRYVDQFRSQDKGMYLQTPGEKAQGYLGFRSKKQNEEMDRLYYAEWQERGAKDTISKNTELILNNLTDKDLVRDLGSEIYQLRGMEGINALIKTIETRKKERATDAFSRKAQVALDKQDAIARANAIKILKGIRPSKSQ